jgi:hypothetical protein
MHFQTGQVIFVPKWPNGEFVSILYCNILFDKNTLRKGCFLAGLSVLFKVFK